MTSASSPGIPKGPLALDIAFFTALLATALALGAALAHVLELANKIGLSQQDYFTVQQIYRRWDLLGVLLAIELVSMLAVIALSRGDRSVFRPAVVAVLGLVAAQAVFWTFTFPANVATRNWTVVADNWQALRNQWEYSHAAGAGFQLLAMCALIVAALARARS